jgi:hypothetical protein
MAAGRGRSQALYVVAREGKPASGHVAKRLDGMIVAMFALLGEARAC